VVISEKLVPHFKPGKALREAVDARVGALRAAQGEDDTGAPEPARGAGSA
jgi:integration host factor subunit beta